MLYLLYFLLFLIGTTEAKQINCNNHPIYCQIVDNSPKINKEYAMDLSNIIARVSREYNIDSVIYTAILMQESGYKLDTINCTTGLKLVYEEDHPIFTEEKVCTDFGISQIHWKTAVNYSLSITSLLIDLEYSVEAGAIVLLDIKRSYGIKEPNTYWTRYNSSNKDKRKQYKKLVERYMP